MTAYSTKKIEMPVDQCDKQDRPTRSTQASKSPKRTQLDKAASSQKAGKSTQVTTLKLYYSARSYKIKF